MKCQPIFFKFLNAPLVHTVKWPRLADRSPFELHAGAQAGQGASKPVTGQAGVTIGGHGAAPTQNALANHCECYVTKTCVKKTTLILLKQIHLAGF